MYVYVSIYEQEERKSLYSIYTWKIEVILLKIKLNNKNKLLHVCMDEKEEKKIFNIAHKEWSIFLKLI